ncbi:MAG: undecaprenyldiphospho-muramoylpentapeptide beta-N-acetylglucosaminyltransferase [Bacteroidales bacterium]
MKHKMIISGGGTGGHIYPAISIANAIKEKHPDADILFVGAQGRMEMEKVPEAGYNIIGLPVMGMQRKLSLKIFGFAWKILKSLRKADKIIRNFSPDVVVGVGGYASGPMLRKASRKGIPCLIQEQNSFPGITNKLLARSVQTICVAYDGLEKWFPQEKIVFTGNPVRQDITNIKHKAPEAMEFFGLDPEKPVLLVVGGSLGAKTINLAIAKSHKKIQNAGIQVLWQFGKYGVKIAEETISPEDKYIKAFEFIHKMDYAFSVADVVVSRAGASTISELCLVQKPSVLVPSPNVAEDHQRKNALALVAKNAAVMVEDNEAVDKLADVAIDMINDKSMQKMYANNIKKFAKPEAANKIADEVLKLIP